MHIETDRQTLIKEGDEEVIRRQEEKRRKASKKREPDPIQEMIDEWIRQQTKKQATKKVEEK